ncbi:MAG: DUF6455 family protein [Rhodobacter sp.]|nr:DUF6455 family protein [Rhodobacter sp.]
MVIRDTSRPHWRALEMAGALGVNIAAALFERRITRQDYGDMIDACQHCTWAEACGVWVRTQTNGAPAAPDICANRTAFAALRR